MNDTLSTMVERKYEQEAKDFCEAIRILAKNEDNLSNFECYLSIHFKAWLEKYASTPGGAAAELMDFATMEGSKED